MESGFSAKNRAQTRSLFLRCRELPSGAEPVASRARAQFVAELVAVSARSFAAASLPLSKSVLTAHPMPRIAAGLCSERC